MSLTPSKFAENPSPFVEGDQLGKAIELEVPYRTEFRMMEARA